jgi:hypothetical protein
LQEKKGNQCKWIRRQAACKPNSVEDDHSSRRRIAARAHSDLPAGYGAPGRHALFGLRRTFPRLFGLAPCGVYPAMRLTEHAVRSYRTFSPLPGSCETGRYLLCGTCRPEALTLRSRTLSGTLPCGVRTFLSRKHVTSGSDRPAACHLYGSPAHPTWGNQFGSGCVTGGSRPANSGR